MSDKIFCKGCGILLMKANTHGAVFNFIAEKVYGDKPHKIDEPIVEFEDGLYCFPCSKRRRMMVRK